MCHAGAQGDEREGSISSGQSGGDVQPLPHGQVCAAREAGTWRRSGISGQESAEGSQLRKRCDHSRVL